MPSQWTSIRQLRSHPNFDLKGERREVFSAALEQAERLWQGSRDVGPAASPMLRFYAVSQAGRALNAGLAPSGNGWRSRSSHGLTMELRDTSGVLTLDDIKVSPHGSGLFQQASELLGSPNLPTTGVSVADLLRTCPLWEVPGESDERFPLAVRAHWASSSVSAEAAVLFVSPVPAHLVSIELVPASPANLEYRRPVITDDKAMWEWLESFPTLRPILPNATVHKMPQRADPLNPNSAWGVRLDWSLGPRPPMRRIDYLDLTVSPPWEHEPIGMLSSAPVGGEVPLAPLMVCWTVLYALSMLSRYYPAQWVRMLDVDESRLAVPLEGIVGTDDEVVPSLLLAAFMRERPARIRRG